MTYKLTNTTSIIRISDGASIPADERNSDYQEYLQWVADGGITEDADPIIEPIVETIVSAWQIRKALNATGLRQAVEDAVAASDITVQDAWQYSNEFQRFNPLVISLGQALGKTEEELDQVFALAKTL